MKCPECGAGDFFLGIFGPNCVRVGCRHFRNGKTSTSPEVRGVSTSRVPEKGFLAWVTLRPESALPREDYVFASREGAERWIDWNGMTNAVPRRVRTPSPISWNPGNGGISLARFLYTLYPEGGLPSNPRGPVAEVLPEEPRGSA